MKAWLAAVAAAALGCDDDRRARRGPPTTCERYAALERRCSDDPESSPALPESTALDFCRKGTSGRHRDVFGPRYEAMIECVKTAQDCEAFRACKAP